MKILLFVVIISVIVHHSSALDCKEVWERKHEAAECCSAPSFVNLENVEIYIEAQDGNPQDKFYCGLHSLFLEQNLLDGDMQLDYDAMKQNTEGFDEEWKQTSQQLIDQCAKKTKATITEMQQRGGPLLRCRPMAGIFITCVGKASFTNCPADKWKSSELCEKVRSGECDMKEHKN